jgi:uncharacterized phage protein (TIGR01671 family)
MRELKFRAWDKEQQIMVYQDENNSADYWDGVHASKIELVNSILKNDSRYEFMQYTGLRDKNGTEIYEGDIVLIYGKGSDLFTEEPFTVEWIGNDEGGYGIGYGLFPSTFDYEVIGNIYEHPHLLGDTDES